MRARNLLVAAAAAFSLGAAGTANAATITLALDPSNTGPYNQIDDSTYFIPRSSNSALQAVILDDEGKPGNTCFKTLSRTLTAPDFGGSGVSCPSSTGSYGWQVGINETEQFKIQNLPDDYNSPAESNVITLTTGPAVHWQTAYRRERQVLNVIVSSDSDDYAGTLELRQGARLIGTRRIAGSGGDVDFTIVPKAKLRRCRGCLVAKGAFTLTLTPNDRSRWVAMTAKGAAVRSRVGDAGPVL